MSQIAAAFSKTIKEFLRERAVLFWTIAWPIVWVLIGSFVFVSGAPKEIVPYLKGSTTISMLVFALMIAGIANLPANIAADRENGLLAKLMSMPISPRKDFVGRILGLAAFSCLAAALVIAVGLACGARFSTTDIGVLQAVGFLLLVICASAGIGLLVGTFIKHVHGAVMTGVGIAVVTSAVSGMFMPYSALPPSLQQFARVYPTASANSLAIYALMGEEIAGYNPLTVSQISLTVALSVFLLILGTILYSRRCWRTE